MQIEIQQLKNDQSGAIINLILPIQQIEFNVPITLEDQPDLLDIEQNYYFNGGMFWGAKINGELVGTIAFIKFDNNSAAIRKMFVKKEYRGKEFSVAQQLLEVLIKYCQENEINGLYLGTVNILNAAIRFYERNGFEKVEKTNLPSLFPRMNADNVFFQLQLT